MKATISVNVNGITEHFSVSFRISPEADRYTVLGSDIILAHNLDQDIRDLLGQMLSTIPAKP